MRLHGANPSKLAFNPVAAAGRWVVLLAVMGLILLLLTVSAQAGQVSLAWDASTSSSVGGYRVYYGRASGNYTTNLDVGAKTAHTVTGLQDGATYYFAVKAYDTTRTIESGFSNQVRAFIPIPAPKANFNANLTSGVAPLTVNFTDNSTGNIRTRFWEFGDGATATTTARNVTRIYANPGVYTVKLTVTGPGGSNALTRTGYISVRAAPPVARFNATPMVGNAPLMVTLTDASSGRITTRTWNFGNGTSQTVQTAQTFVKIYGTTTPRTHYTVTLTVTGPGGSSRATRTLSVTAVPPAANFSASPTRGIAPLVTLFKNASTGTVTRYSWNFGDGAASAAANPAHTYAKAGVYTVSLTAKGPVGASTKTRTGYITVSRVGLVAAYNFQETSGATVVDVSGKSNHGVIRGATRAAAGKFGRALSFDGVNDWVTIKDAASLDLTTGMTLEAWIYPRNLADRRPILAKQGTTQGAPARGFLLSAGNPGGAGKVEAEVSKNDSTRSSLLSTTALGKNQWQHVAFVYRYLASGNSTMTIYINGQAKGSYAAAVGPVQANAQPLDLGRYFWNSGYGRYFNGLIDEVRIYNRALSTAEIQADMNTPVR